MALLDDAVFQVELTLEAETDGVGGREEMTNMKCSRVGTTGGDGDLYLAAAPSCTTSPTFATTLQCNAMKKVEKYSLLRQRGREGIVISCCKSFGSLERGLRTKI